MNNIVFVFLRRMRAPLLVLLGAYAISIAGLVLMPGQDDQGNPWYFDFFHAVYFVSFMGSTIGFGEIPYPFSAAQRLWTTVALYICVIAWLYAIGNILALLQNPVFRRSVSQQRFADSVKSLSQPFFIVCGFGETARFLIDALNARQQQCVVIDSDQDRMDQLLLGVNSPDIPALAGDAGVIQNLLDAGLKHPQCQGVIALTNHEQINVKIAITVKLLRPALMVVCRANSPSTAANLSSFNTDHVVNPFKVFADHLAIALREPRVHLLYSWLSSTANQPLPTPIRPPRGTWIICGFGRFGTEVHRYLEYEGIPTVVIEPDESQAPKSAIIGRGTEATTLRAAGIEKAVGLVAGADQDINNLSIVMTAKELNPDLFIVARQNHHANQTIFDVAGLDLIMETSHIMMMRILPLTMKPSLLHPFLIEVRHRSGEWADELLKRLKGICRGRTPTTWGFEVSSTSTPALHRALENGHTITVEQLLSWPTSDPTGHHTIVLMIIHQGQESILPPGDHLLHIGDELLVTANRQGADQLLWTLNNDNIMEYLITGEFRTHNPLLRRIEHWWQHKRSTTDA